LEAISELFVRTVYYPRMVIHLIQLDEGSVDWLYVEIMVYLFTGHQSS